MAINPAEITTIRVGELPVGTIDLTSKIGVENGTDLQQVSGQDLVDFVNINANAFQFEIKDLWVSQAYIDDNFDETGLGVELCEGYAICNGQNGTPNLDGLVSVGYGNNYSVIKAIGGNKEVALVAGNLPSIDITLPVSNAGGGGSPYTYVVASGSGTPASKTYTNVTGNTIPTKVNNMQPYMVLLKIMKL